MELLDTVLSEVSTLLDMPLPLQLSPPLLMLPQLPLMLMLLQLPPMLMLLQLPLLMLPQLSTLLPLPLPPPPLSTLLSLLPLLLELPELSLSKNTQKKMQNSSRTTKFHLKSDKNDKMTNEFENVRFPFP